MSSVDDNSSSSIPRSSFTALAASLVLDTDHHSNAETEGDGDSDRSGDNDFTVSEMSESQLSTNNISLNASVDGDLQLHHTEDNVAHGGNETDARDGENSVDIRAHAEENKDENNSGSKVSVLENYSKDSCLDEDLQNAIRNMRIDTDNNIPSNSLGSQMNGNGTEYNRPSHLSSDSLVNGVTYSSVEQHDHAIRFTEGNCSHRDTVDVERGGNKKLLVENELNVNESRLEGSEEIDKAAAVSAGDSRSTNTQYVEHYPTPPPSVLANERATAIHNDDSTTDNNVAAVGGSLSPSSSATDISKQSTPRQRSRKQSTIKPTSPTEKSSLLTRGMSLFGRSAQTPRPSLDKNKSSPAMRNKEDNSDESSVVSDISHGFRSVKSTKSQSTLLRPTADDANDDALKQHLEESGLILVKRLVEFLSECPPAPDEVKTDTESKRKKQRGLTLPASAVGWISRQVSQRNVKSGDNQCDNSMEEVFDCYQLPEQQLQCLETLLRRVSSLRVTRDAWPPPLALANSAIESAKKSFASIPEKGSLSSKLLSKFTADQSVASLDDESCGTGISQEKELNLTAFKRYWHELQHNPNVNMTLFPYATKVVIDGIPPHWVTNMDSLAMLDMFQMEKGCILDVNKLFFPSDADDIVPRDVVGKEIDAAVELNGETSIKVYSSLSKLRLSNCAIGEAAGLRGRAVVKRSDTPRPQRVPTLSRFPNLVSLNLSHNELFRIKTALAGLSSLPLLSSINLAYNRLIRYDDNVSVVTLTILLCSSLSNGITCIAPQCNSMDGVFMLVGNVKEVILTGNEITSTQGLDRLFSLERLSLDENKIQHLANIAGIAKLPFLMNFDLKGNPLETCG